jgi:hypothetical protein
MQELKNKEDEQFAEFKSWWLTQNWAHQGGQTEWLKPLWWSAYHIQKNGARIVFKVEEWRSEIYNESAQEWEKSESATDYRISTIKNPAGQEKSRAMSKSEIDFAIKKTNEMNTCSKEERMFLGRALTSYCSDIGEHDYGAVWMLECTKQSLTALFDNEMRRKKQEEVSRAVWSFIEAQVLADSTNCQVVKKKGRAL